MTYAHRSYPDAEISVPDLGEGLRFYASLETSPDALEQSRRRGYLQLALNQLAGDRGSDQSVSGKSLEIAHQLVENLPINRALPKVAVDQDGDVIMLWDGPKGRCELTVEGSALHMVVNPGADSTHIEPTMYHGGHIPPRILQHIPVR